MSPFVLEEMYRMFVCHFVSFFLQMGNVDITIFYVGLGTFKGTVQWTCLRRGTVSCLLLQWELKPNGSINMVGLCIWKTSNHYGTA